MIRAAHRPVGGPASLGALIASLLLASSAFAGATYPPGPNGCCPDTLTIVHLRNPAADPHPVAGDVVLGIQGIVTGFAPHFGPYGFYMQMPGGAPYSGVAVFTGNVDHQSDLAIGDLVAVYGKVQHFSDTDAGGSNTDGVAIGSLDGTNSVVTPSTLSPSQGDVLVRVISHGNALPSPHVGTLAELDQSKDNPAGDPWLGMLVQLPGPLVVGPGTASATGTLALSNPGTFLVGDPSCTSSCDAALVDGGYLADVTPPAPGTILGGVQGIFDLRSGSHVIQLRGPDDILSGNTPHAIDAFPIFDNDLAGTQRRDSLMVVFDRKVEKASAEDAANYALTSGGTIDGVQRLDAPDDDRVVLAIRNGLLEGAPEAITVHGVKSLQDGTPMFTPNTLDFFNGVLETEEVAAPDPAALAGSPCDDRSRFSGPGASAGERASFTGTVTGVFGDLVAIQGAPPRRAGLWVQAPGTNLIVGESYLFAGALQQVSGETQGTDLVYVRDLGAGPTVTPALQSIPVLTDDTCDPTQLFLNGKDLEGMLVTVDRVVITGSAPPGGDFTVAVPGTVTPGAALLRPVAESGPQNQILVVNGGTFTPVGGRIVSVTGVLGRVGGDLAIFLPGDGSFHDYGPVPVFSLPLDVSKSATESRDPDIVRGVNGELFMGWDRVFHESVHSLSLDNTQNWSLALPIMHQGVQPAITVTPSNKFSVLSATTDELLYKQSTDGGHQMDPQVTVVDANPTQFPAITVGSGEHLHAAWERTGAGIYYARSFSGGLGFDAPVPIALNNDDSNSLVRIAASTADNVYVFWQYHQPGEPGVDKVLYRRSLDGGTSFANARLVRDESNPLTSTVKLAFLGDAQVGPDGTVWVLGVEQGSNTVALLKSANEAFTFALAGELPGLPSEGGVCPKSFTVGPDGSIHALVAICGVALYYTRSSDGGQTWTDPVNVSSDQSAGIGEPRGAKIILDGSGTPVIVWYASAGGSTEIYSSRLLN